MVSDFAQTLAMGVAAEEALTAWLRRQGHVVLPIAQAIGNGNGPRLYCPDAVITVPDLIVLGTDGKPVWLESKAKGSFSLHRTTGDWVTGIDIRHYQNYLDVMQRTGWGVWLLFVAESAQYGAPRAGLYAARLDELQQREHHRWTSPRNQYGKGGMVYWGVDVFEYLATLDEINAKDSSRWQV